MYVCNHVRTTEGPHRCHLHWHGHCPVQGSYLAMQLRLAGGTKTAKSAKIQSLVLYCWCMWGRAIVWHRQQIEGLWLCDCRCMCLSTKKYFLALWIITAANRLPKLATERPLVHKGVFLHMSLSVPLHANPRERGHAPSRYLTTKMFPATYPV